MSRRARSRPDKRAIAHYTGEATDIEAAFAKLTAERAARAVEPSLKRRAARLRKGSR